MGEAEGQWEEGAPCKNMLEAFATKAQGALGQVLDSQQALGSL